MDHLFYGVLLDAALSGDRHQVIFASGKGFDSKTFNVPSGKYLGWYLVANGTTDQAIAKGGNAPPVFFSYAAANEDGLNHVHAQQDSQTWAWEDFWGGGDRDFDDLVFRFSFGEPIGEPIQLPSLSIENTTVTEGNTGTQSANFTVRLSAPTNTTVTAQFTTKDGTAQAGTDYESSTGILTFAPGEVEKKIAVAVKGDTISEPTETFTVNLTGVTNAILIQGEGIGTILDNDNSPNPPDNNPPVTDADKTITLPEDSQPIPLNINPPTDIDGDTLTVSVTQLPDNSKGRITLADGTVINVGDEISINSLTSLLYRPLADVNGNGGNFIYTVSDGKGGSDSQTISFVITPENTSVNNPPVTDADKTITLPEDSQPIPLNINPPTDIDGDTLTVSVTQLPDNSKGKITLADGTVINVGDKISINSLTSLLYRPLADVNGNGGNFIYTVSDGKGGSDSQTISFIITPENTSVNNPPVTDADKTITLPEDSQPIPLNINPPTDIDGDTLRVFVTQLPDNSKGKITLADGTVINVGDEISINSLTSLLYTPLADVNGNGGNFVYTVSDGKGGNDSQTISFVITPENTSGNNSPVTDADKTITLPEDSQPIPLNINPPTDIDGDTLTVSVTQLPDNSKGRITLADGTVINVGDEISINSLTSLLYTPLADVNGNGGNFVYTVSDGKGGSDSQTISFVITPENTSVNNPPVTDADKTITLPEDSQPIPLNINPPTDIDGDTLRVSVTQLPDNSKGRITLADGTVINVGDEISINSLTSLLYTPLADVNGNGGNFVYTVSDGKGGSDSQTISFIITPENTSGNNPPVTDADKTITLPEDSQPIPLNINTPTDIDGDTLTVSVTQLPDNSKGKITLADGTVINVGDEISINSLTSLLYTPLADVNGNGGNFVYTVSDGKGGNDSQTISFVINPNNLIVSAVSANNAPEFTTNPELKIIVGNDYSYDANAVDADNDTLFYSLSLAPDGLTIDNNTGVLSWQSPTIGNYNISISVEDGKGGRDTQTYNLGVVTNVIDSQPNRPPVFVSNPVVSGNLNTEYRYDADATDADNDNLTYSVINAPNGLVINQSTGVVTFTPTVSGATEITLQVDDGKGGIATQVYTLLVLEEETDNYAPVIISEPILKASTSQNYVYDVNAIDPDEDNLTYSLVDAPQGMSIDNLTGEIVWNTAGKTVGNYDISVKVTDNRGGVDTQEFVIALNNALLGTIEGVKWEDTNGNGIWDSANFEDFSVDVSSLILSGDTAIVDNALRLSLNSFYSSGNALLKNPFNLVRDSNQNLLFSTNFKFSISESSGLGDEDGEGADGIAFIISPTDTIGSAGGGIGYEGLNNTVVVELDTFNNGSQDQNNGNHIGINVNGSTTSIVQANIPTRFNNGEIWNVWIDYNGSSQLLEARVSQDSNRPTQATVSATVNIAEILGQNEFFVGFTSATGAGLGNHDILSWTFINNEPALEGITVYLDSNNNGTFDNNEPSQITDENGKYQFTGLEAGTYIVREIIPTDYKQTYPGGQPTDSLGDGFADVILDYFNSGAGTFNEPYGADNDGNGPVLVSVDIILGSDTLGALSLPTGSYVTVGFTDEIIIDKPGNDIFIPEIGFAGEQAEVYVSSNLEDFVLLGIGDGGTTSIFDLASINFNQPVRAIKIVGLDNNGLSPGFDVINVQGLPGSIASPDFYTVKLKAGETVSNINFGNQKIDQPIPNQAPVFTSTAPQTAQIGQLLTYRATATDANNDRLTYSLLNQPEGMAVDAETGSLIWQPKQNQIGNNRVVLRVSDGKGGIATQEFFLNTKGINTPPQIISSPNTVTLINNTYSYEVRATDFDNDTLTYSLINPPEGMTINANTGLIVYTPTNLGKQTVEIKVSDGFGGTNTQSYQLQVLATLDNNLPSITSTPKIIIGAGGLYQYDVEANDPENTAISYNLTVKPNGMTIDTNTGLITWQTQNTTNGDFQVTVTATDADGGIAYQNYYIRVTPNQAPIINSQPLELAQLGVTYKYDVIAKDADNDTLTYNLLQAPQGLTIDQFGRIRWQSASQNQGIYPVTIQVSDGRGGITTQTYNLTLSNDDITNPVVELGFNSNLINIGESINFQVRATDNIEVKTLTLTANTTPLTLNPNSPNGQINTATFVGQKAGLYQIVATATDAAGNQDTETIEVRVLDPSDTEAPVVEINKTNLEATQGIIKSPTDIIATITDDNLEFYRVEIAPIEAVDLSNIGENDPDYTLLTKGTQNITNQQVANLDPRLLANGSYLIKITAFDFSGNGNVQGVILNVTGQNKPGDFSLEYTDLSIPLTGIPIEIVRRYNSLESASQGDFGYGWDLGLQDAKIVESSPDGRDLSEANSDFFGTSNTFSVGTRVTLNTPDGRRVGFTFNPVPVSASFFGAIYAPKFTPDAGVFDKLEVENTPLTIRSDGTVGAFLFSFLGYNPSQYKLTTKDGTVYNYDQNFGLIDVTDRNGNKLTFSDEGIISSTGAEIDFIRDAQGRITEIIDPDGKSIKYVYDSNGDLIEVIDRTNNTTQLVYDDPNRQHFLTEIIDPLGRSATRTEYDENGQISKIIDANGNELNITFDNATNSQTVKDPFGKTITRVFDAQGNVIQEVDQLGGITLRTYDEDNNLLSETDPEGNITSYTYDSRGNKLTETDGEGNKKTFTYNQSNDILTETTALGFVTTYTYDNNGNLTKREDTESNVTEYKYDSLGLLTTVTDANGKISNFKYDNRGNLTELTDPTGAKTTFTYDSNGRVASVTDALGAITNYIYDAQGRLIEKADPEGSSCGCARGITKTEYNAAGEKVAEIDALGRRTEYRYNDRGLLIETILPDSTPDNLSNNPRTKNEYDALDRLTGFIDELGRKTIYIYDALGREIEVIYPDSTPDNLTDNPRTKKEYDKAGRKIAEIDELGNRTEFNYDQADRLLTVTNALNQITSYNYDADGRQIAMTDALGRITEYDYDELDRLLTTTYANNAVMTTTYDPLGRVIAETDLAGNTSNYEYDALGRLTAVIDALNQRTEYKYDLVGNLIEQKDANGNITKFEYDSLRRLKATILPGGQRNETIHDKIGNLIKVTDFNGAVTTYKYNERNWLTEKSFSDGTATETFTYTLTGELATVIDNRGMTNYVYDERDRLISRTEPDNRTISYTYDKASNILTLTVPSGTTTYTYDGLNRLDTVKDADNGVTDYDYDAVGNLVKTVFPNGVTENQQYDLLNRLTYLENRNDAGIISSYTYTLDAMGNRVKVVENDGRTVEYTYDNLYRLTQEKITDTVAGNKTITYSFDVVGNRLEKVDSVEGKTTYNYDKNDRLLKEILGGNVTQYQYDDEGNLLAKVENGATTTNYEWNAKGELTAVEVTENGETGRIEFEYDHNGIRVAIDVDGEVTRFLIDNNQQQYAQVIEEYQTNGTVNTTYTHGWDLISQNDGANRIYYQVDGLGSTRLMTGNNGSVIVEYDYDAYGNLTRKVGDAENNYLFAGEQFDDAVDGYYLRARYYDPNTGRFASVDPFEGYNNQPITLHDYLYAGVNPVNAIDPSGEVAFVEYLKKATITTVAFLARNKEPIIKIVEFLIESFYFIGQLLDPTIQTPPTAPPEPTRKESPANPSGNPANPSGNNGGGGKPPPNSQPPNSQPPNNPPRNPDPKDNRPANQSPPNPRSPQARPPRMLRGRGFFR
ncbi:Ig-like domain-containing protein [Microcystis flos-aquae]|uniref:Ig-like domain-containing protein n=1 Tax=Microcystis flos-aquae TaxID=109615 RepID=UPI001F557B4C|nr:Ig-like domain-containing protein [Microcystis flos-aquae]